MYKFISVSLLTLVFLLASPALVAAHTSTKSVSPAKEAVVTSAEQEIAITFTEAVSLTGATIEISDSKGNKLPGALLSYKDEFTISRTATLYSETFTVKYRVVSNDGHPVSNQYSFTADIPISIATTTTTTHPVAQSPTAAPTNTTESTTDLVSLLYTSFKFLGYLGLLFGLGAGTLLLFKRPEPNPLLLTLIKVGASVLALSSILTLLIYNSYLLGTGNFQLGLSQTLESRVGAVHVLRLTLILFIFIMLKSKWLVPLLILTALTFPLTSHAAADSNLFYFFTDALHILAAFSWVGGLAALFLLVYKSKDLVESELLVRKFSKVAIVSVIVLILTGLLQSIHRMDSLDTLTSTSYGQLLIAKTLLVLLVLVVASVSRKLAHSRIFSSFTRKNLLKAVFIELVILLAIVGTTTALTQADYQEDTQDCIHICE